MQPIYQKQHKIPKVYLKKFGYLNASNQWMVSVLKAGENSTQQKSIKSFTATTNIFDIESDDPGLTRIFEELNGDYETEYNNILRELEKNGSLNGKHYSYLLQFISNLICRSDEWRGFILQMLIGDDKKNFVQVIVGHHFKTYPEFQSIPEMTFFKLLFDIPPDKAVNRVLLYFAGHVLHRLWNYEIVFIQSQDDKPWFTSTNPVIMHNRTARIEIMSKESEIYFPLSPKYLAYLHFKDSDDKENELRKLETNKIHLATDSENETIQQIILKNQAEYLIIAGEMEYKSEIETKIVSL